MSTARAAATTATDVYVKDIGDDGIYGYAAPGPGQTGPQPATPSW